MKVVIISNIPAPYRVSFFNYLIDTYSKFNFYIIYSAKEENDRGWCIDEQMKNSRFINSKSIKINQKLDTKHIHLSFDILKELNDINPDIVVSAEYNINSIISFIWCKLKSKKYISWSDGTLNSEKNINFIQKIVRKLICRKANALIASSTKTKEAQISYGASTNKIFISYLTVDIDKYLYVKKEYHENILFVGRLSNCKGVDLLLKALANVENYFNLTIVGSGPEKNELIEIAKRLGINDKVKFVGSKTGTDLINEYRKSDIFILPSKCDCFGLVLTEAMCNSLAIIGSKYADGSFDLIEENVNGVIIDPYDTKLFSKTIDNMLEEEEKVEFMGKKSYEKVKEFSYKEVSKGFISALENA